MQTLFDACQNRMRDGEDVFDGVVQILVATLVVHAGEAVTFHNAAQAVAKYLGTSKKS